MPELLLELGTEELPASEVRRAYTDLQALLTVALREADVLRGESRVLGTPRRLIVSFPDLADRQPDQVKELRGPSLQAAYDAERNPSKALLGFCRSQGVEPGDLRQDDQYVWASKHQTGRPTAELLTEIIPKAIRSLTFAKTMRWGTSRMRFARPIRWILAAFDGLPVEFAVEGVTSGIESRGHRFYAPEPFPATSLDALVTSLRSKHVEPDPDVRRQMIVDGARHVAGGDPDLQQSLIEENVFLTEWPTAIMGTFRDEYKSLPQPVLVTAMAKHEKMFPVRENGALSNRFVFIRNSGEDETVRQGAAWVLNARFNDAKFFFDEDAKHPLDAFLAKTEGILFQEKLGTVRQRADRLQNLARAIAIATGASEEESQWAAQAGLYAKADLSTGLVSELSSLQGVIGGEYCRRAGLPEPVNHAIARQYDIGAATSRTDLILIIADQLDKLAGYLGIGLAPTGSSDPYGLRRAANVLVEAAWKWPGTLPAYEGWFRLASDAYHSEAMGAFTELMASRYAALLPDVRYDLLDAALLDRSPAVVTAPRSVKMRLACLERLADEVPFVQSATRPINIVSAAERKDESIPAFDDSQAKALESAEGVALAEAVRAVLPPLMSALESEDDEAIARPLAGLAAPINQFFDSTMVMVEVPSIRAARLSLLRFTAQTLMVAGDWTKIVMEG